MTIDREALIKAIDELHEGAVDNSWAEAERLAEALGWRGAPFEQPEGQWIRARLDEAMR